MFRAAERSAEQLYVGTVGEYLVVDRGSARPQKDQRLTSSDTPHMVPRQIANKNSGVWDTMWG